ncbi:NADP-dependent isocitrate dehydrogenase [Streptomyces fradiae]
MEQPVGRGDIFRMCQTKDAPIRDWVKAGRVAPVLPVFHAVHAAAGPDRRPPRGGTARVPRSGRSRPAGPAQGGPGPGQARSPLTPGAGRPRRPARCGRCGRRAGPRRAP